MSAVLMLRHLGQGEMAAAIEKALFATFAAGIRTPDLGGQAATMEFAKAVSERLRTDN
jgi:isocitrate/isopropylmalate dehydrogenase